MSKQQIQSHKISAGRFFEDFVLNEVIHHAAPRTITAGDAALYIGLYGGRNPLHCSEPFAQALGYKTMPIDDMLAFHIAFGKTVPDISVNAVANLGYADVRFIQPVFVGDTLTTSSEVIGQKQNSNGKSGVIWVRSTSVNQHQTPVLSWVRWVMVHKNKLDTPAPQSVIPSLPSYVAPEHLNSHASLLGKGFNYQATSGQFGWHDYAIGERLNHPASMLINDSDHAIATRLYQNNARLHFNKLSNSQIAGGEGKALVYGGVVISLCRALSYEGLENAISMLAINAGTHVNPVFAGDTIHTYTEVIDKLPLSNNAHFGALRLRMVGIKNAASHTISQLKNDAGYQPNVVLDLDYTVLMPYKGK